MAIHYDHWLAKLLKPKAWDVFGLTLTKNIILMAQSKLLTPAWLERHEADHQKRIANEGWIYSMTIGLFHRIKYGYYNSPEEVRARQAEGDHTQ